MVPKLLLMAKEVYQKHWQVVLFLIIEFFIILHKQLIMRRNFVKIRNLSINQQYVEN